MATNKQAASATRRKGDRNRKPKPRLGQSPIIITGGSVSLRVPDYTDANDHFNYDNGSSAPMQHLDYNHSQNQTEPKLAVLRVEIVRKDDGRVLYNHNLDRLGVGNNCLIKIHYGPATPQ